MSQRDRDRLKVLHEVRKGQITQKQAAGQLKLTERQVRRMLKKLEISGDAGVIHGLRGRAGNRRISPEVEQRATEELSRSECADFGPTFAAEHLWKHLGIRAGRDTVRRWMTEAGLWKPRRRKLETIHQWRQRRACAGELVQWDTSVHDWLEGRGERLYLIAMIDDATSRVFARFVKRDSAEENLRVLWGYLEAYGRPLAFYTDKAAMFEVALKRAADNDPPEMGLTQITRALAELGIERISAHSPQAKGRIERFFETAQDRLIKELRIQGVSTMQAANQYLAETFLPDWQERFAVPAANPTDAHRPLTEMHNLAASLSHVVSRKVTSDYTFPFQGKRFQIARSSASAGLRGAQIRVEARLDGAIAARFEGRYLEVSECPAQPAAPPAKPGGTAVRKDHNRGGRSNWMREYPLNLSRTARTRS